MDSLRAPAANVLVADLVHDTATDGLPAGVRSGTLGCARRLLFAVDEVEIMLQVSPRADGVADVAGQVAVGDIPLVGVPVRLEVHDEHSTVTTERGGGFWFPTPGGRACRLVVSAHGYEVRTAQFRPGVLTVPAAVGAGHLLDRLGEAGAMSQGEFTAPCGCMWLDDQLEVPCPAWPDLAAEHYRLRRTRNPECAEVRRVERELAGHMLRRLVEPRPAAATPGGCARS